MHATYIVYPPDDWQSNDHLAQVSSELSKLTFVAASALSSAVTMFTLERNHDIECASRYTTSTS